MEPARKSATHLSVGLHVHFGTGVIESCRTDWHGTSGADAGGRAIHAGAGADHQLVATAHASPPLRSAHGDQGILLHAPRTSTGARAANGAISESRSRPAFGV